MSSKHQLSPEDIWLPNIRHTPSPNQNERPAEQPISLLVIHNISLPPGIFGGDAVEAFFQNRLDSAAHPFFAEIANLRVSSHLYIRRDGTAQQFVALNKRAWHAGHSCFAGQSDCNDYAIGIELEGTDNLPFEPAQYTCLIRLTRQIRTLFPLITPERIVGHSDIAPGRKTDPGPQFDWPRFISSV
ncbi:MAG: 1,6-anhydro-N-acetylmuramyl-L-alanine amidase AmpD [Pseudomonadota bacterium]